MLVTPELTRAFWAHMGEHFDSRVVDRHGALEMIQVGKFLDSMGVMEQEDFLNGYATTIGHTIYVPWTVGEGDEPTLIQQIRTCVHEHQHVHQFDRDGGVRFSVGYLADSVTRANYEAEAFRSNMEINHWFGLPAVDPARYARKLEHYACAELDIRVTTATLISSAATVAAGGVLNYASKVAIAWLDVHQEL